MLVGKRNDDEVYQLLRRLISTEAEIIRYFPSPPAPLPEGEGRKIYEKIAVSVLMNVSARCRPKTCFGTPCVPRGCRPKTGFPRSHAGAWEREETYWYA